MMKDVATSDAAMPADPGGVRSLIRQGMLCGHTAGLAPGRLQANLVILPESYALDFMRYCQRNPKPCPLVGVTETGDPYFRTLGTEIDVRVDLPAYNIYRHGDLVESRSDLTDLWQNDFVAFALGCSFTFERALMAAGMPLDHIEADRTVAMYRTSIETRVAGPFRGGMVVSMRPIANDRVTDAVSISKKYPLAHGAPVHVGDPEAIGIANLNAPEWGDPPLTHCDRTPVFWACGVTPQNAIRQAKPPICITHKPGCMLITDIDEFAETPFVPIA
ncbi:MAG: putative hydro-lyase [Geminicoccales bacterium]